MLREQNKINNQIRIEQEVKITNITDPKPEQQEKKKSATQYQPRPKHPGAVKGMLEAYAYAKNLVARGMFLQ